MKYGSRSRARRQRIGVPILNSSGRRGVAVRGAVPAGCDMPAEKYAATRTDGGRVPSKIRELIRLMIEDGMAWQKAADAVGLPRQRARRALAKPHVRTHLSEQRKAFLDVLSTRVPHKLNELMDSENAAAAVRATLALEEMAQQSHALPMRRISTGGIVIVLGGAGQHALGAQGAPAIEHDRLPEMEAVEE
jgi:hypothetical protein